MKKRMLIRALITILVLWMSLSFFYSQYQLRYGQTVYTFDIATEDLYFRDMDIVAVSPYALYTTGHFLEIRGENKSFDGISYGFSIGDTMILSRSQAGDPFTFPDASNGKVYCDTSNLIKDIRVHKRDSLQVEIHYTVNGEPKEIVGEIKLSDVIRPFSYNNNKIVHLQ
ncbi:hypothetical protein [Paenibacillus lentus]|uniref:Uncharacterized protein n=1 Tax=Paenibacillus lentus TaxID=1338368 RepID=A0A3S8RPW4_9BACL|nr:hypothetical protein [Paenibacillus lentus]AZK44981.1 hypothetical protein EIM92_01225 [Paenibacillus lentus]